MTSTTKGRLWIIWAVILAFGLTAVPAQLAPTCGDSCALQEHQLAPRRDESDLQQWSYEGSTGPEYWANIIPAAYLCRTGTLQSPINIVKSDVKKQFIGDLQFNYSSNSRGELWNNGHSIQYVIDNSTGFSTLTGGPMRSEVFFLLQLHQHAPSEHTLDGKRYPMEIHFVHLSNDTTPHLAAVAVFIEEGPPSPFLDQYFHLFSYTVPKKTDRYKLTGINVQIAIPDNTSYWTYKGSRTSPDCEEGFTWLVLNKPMTASPAQIQSFTDIYQKTNRPTQPLHQRSVYQHISGIQPPCTGNNPATKKGFPWELVSVFAVIFFGILLLRVVNSSAGPDAFA